MAQLRLSFSKPPAILALPLLPPQADADPVVNRPPDEQNAPLGYLPGHETTTSTGGVSNKTPAETRATAIDSLRMTAKDAKRRLARLERQPVVLPSADVIALRAYARLTGTQFEWRVPEFATQLLSTFGKTTGRPLRLSDVLAGIRSVLAGPRVPQESVPVKSALEPVDLEAVRIAGALLDDPAGLGEIPLLAAITRRDQQPPTLKALQEAVARLPEDSDRTFQAIKAQAPANAKIIHDLLRAHRSDFHLREGVAAVINAFGIAALPILISKLKSEDPVDVAVAAELIEPLGRTARGSFDALLETLERLGSPGVFDDERPGDDQRKIQWAREQAFEALAAVADDVLPVNADRLLKVVRDHLDWTWIAQKDITHILTGYLASRLGKKGAPLIPVLLEKSINGVNFANTLISNLGQDGWPVLAEILLTGAHHRMELWEFVRDEVGPPPRAVAEQLVAAMVAGSESMPLREILKVVPVDLQRRVVEHWFQPQDRPVNMDLGVLMSVGSSLGPEEELHKSIVALLRSEAEPARQPSSQIREYLCQCLLRLLPEAEGVKLLQEAIQEEEHGAWARLILLEKGKSRSGKVWADFLPGETAKLRAPFTHLVP